MTKKVKRGETASYDAPGPRAASAAGKSTAVSRRYGSQQKAASSPSQTGATSHIPLQPRLGSVDWFGVDLSAPAPVQKRAKPNTGVPWASVSRSSIHFPDTKPGNRAKPVDITITNRDTKPLPIEDISVVPPIAHDPFPVYAAAQQTIPSGARLTVQVGFAPTKPGKYDERLHVLTTGGISVAHVDVQGHAITTSSNNHKPAKHKSRGNPKTTSTKTKQAGGAQGAAETNPTWEAFLSNVLGEKNAKLVTAIFGAYTQGDSYLNANNNRPGILDPHTCAAEDERGGKKSGANCFLTESRRIEVRAEVRARADEVKGAFRQAVNEIGRERLRRAIAASKGTGWEMVINILFTVATRGLSGQVLKTWERYKPIHYKQEILAVARFGTEGEIEAAATKAAASRKDVVATAMSAFGRVGRASALSKARAAGKKVAESEADKSAPKTLVDSLEFGMALWAQSVRGGVGSLDDYQLLAVHELLDANHHPKERYKLEIQKVIARYDQQVGVIGTYGGKPGERKLRQAVKIQAYGKTRVALCYAPQTAYQRKKASGLKDMPDLPVEENAIGRRGGPVTLERALRGHNLNPRFVDGDLKQLSEVLKRATFIKWIDDDLVEFAVANNRHQVGSVLTFRLDHAMEVDKFQGAPEVAAWLKKARAGSSSR